MIVCGKAICLQLATGRITHTQANINTLTLNGTRHATGCVFVCVYAEIRHRITIKIVS